MKAYHTKLYDHFQRYDNTGRKDSWSRKTCILGENNQLQDIISSRTHTFTLHMILSVHLSTACRKYWNGHRHYLKKVRMTVALTRLKHARFRTHTHTNTNTHYVTYTRNTHDHNFRSQTSLPRVIIPWRMLWLMPQQRRHVMSLGWQTQRRPPLLQPPWYAIYFLFLCCDYYTDSLAWLDLPGLALTSTTSLISLSSLVFP